MTDNENYQMLIGQIWKCMSLQPSGYTYIGGQNVITATINPPSGGGTDKSYSELTMYSVPPEGSTVIPTESSQKSSLQAAVAITGVEREGVGMQSTDPSRPDYYSVNLTNGEITIVSEASGTEIFKITYKVLVNV
jgi:hypothetical protein